MPITYLGYYYMIVSRVNVTRTNKNDRIINNWCFQISFTWFEQQLFVQQQQLLLLMMMMMMERVIMKKKNLMNENDDDEVVAVAVVDSDE